MKSILVIINGISLPYQVIDYAIAEAKKNSCEINVLFLKGIREPPKGYAFPSDLGATESWTSDADAVKEDEKIILDNMKLVKEMVEGEKITYSSEIETNASIDRVKALSAAADLIVIDEHFDKMSLLSDLYVSLKAIINKSGKPVYAVPATNLP